MLFLSPNGPTPIYIMSKNKLLIPIPLSRVALAALGVAYKSVLSSFLGGRDSRVVQKIRQICFSSRPVLDGRRPGPRYDRSTRNRHQGVGVRMLTRTACNRKKLRLPFRRAATCRPGHAGRNRFLINANFESFGNAAPSRTLKGEVFAWRNTEAPPSHESEPAAVVSHAFARHDSELARERYIA